MSVVRSFASTSAEHAKEQKRILWLSILMFLAFVAVVLASCLVSIRVVDEQAADRSEILARTAATKDVELRDWIATLGGIFVPLTDATPPNPYLSPVGREMTGPDGNILTKMNPAYVTRLLHERWGDKYGMIGHITSLKPVRPQNAASPWEAIALTRLIERGGGEFSAIHEENGVRTLQHMTSLHAKPGCLKCHTTQGYLVGDVMGGISNTVPFTLVTGTDAQVRKALILGYMAVSLLMLGFFVWGGRFLMRRNDEQHETELALQEMALTLEERVKERTEELQLSKENTELILSSTFEGIAEVDMNGVILFINKAGREMTGYDAGDCLRSVFAGTLADDTHGHGCGCPSCMAIAASVQRRFSDVRMRCTDGQIIFIDGSISSVIRNGLHSGSIFVFHNISDYSKLECLQQAIFASSTEPFLLFSPKNLTLCNSAAVDFFGVDSAEELCRDFLKFCADSQDGVATEVCIDTYFEECDKSSKASFNWVHRHNDGSLLPCRITMSKIEHPLYSGFLASIMDLRTLQRYETKLQQDKELLDKIINASPMPMYIEDAEGVVSVINPAASDLLPLSIGCPGADAWKDKDILSDLQQRVRTAEHIVAYPAKLQSRNPHEHLETRTSLSSVLYEGQDACLVWVQDISDLVFAKEQAENFSRAKSDFLARMSHEIRTPMNAILGMTYLFLQNPVEDWQRRYILKIQEASKGLLGIINDILDFSRIEAGKMELEITAFSLSELVENVANVCSPMAEEKKLELLFHIDPTMHGVYEGDLLRLSQVLINLVSNAVKFTAKGDVLLRINEVERHCADITLAFEVRDSGMGMTEEQLSRLFQPFEQADVSTTRRFGGTGLGLVICNELVQMMGSSITVESVMNEGSVFRFQLSLKGKDLNTASKYHAIAHNERVLVVDDNDAARNLLRDMITCFGFRVDVVASGEAACGNILWAASTNTPYSIVILDWKMPGMDGFECAKLINELPISVPPKLLMISAYGLDEYARKGNSAGLMDYISKPVTPSALFNALARIVGGEALTVDSKNTKVQLEMNLGGIRGAHILLVEDNETNQEVASTLLTRLGMEVEVAGNGLEAVNLCKIHKYDLVFMDIQMPVMDGLEAVRRIRVDEGDGLRVPIVAMTAHAMKSDRDKSFEAGMNDHITKPIDPGMLSTALLKWIVPLHADVAELVSASEPQSAAPSLPYIVSGVDVAKGLHNVGDDVQSLTHHLLRFVERYGSYAENLEAAVQEDRWEDATRTAHTLKGVGATLGMADLASYAGQMEKLCSVQAITPEQIRHLGTMIVDMCASIQETLGKTEAFVQNEGGPSDKKALCRLLHLLPELLARDIGRCMATLTEIKGFVPELMNAVQYKALYDAVYEFNSDAVAAVAAEVEAELNETKN